MTCVFFEVRGCNILSKKELRGSLQVLYCTPPPQEHRAPCLEAKVVPSTDAPESWVLKEKLSLQPSWSR